MADPTVLPDFSKLVTNLNASGVQSWNPELHTILKGLISSVGQSQEVITGTKGGGIFNITNITGGGGADLDYSGDYVTRTYNDGDIVVASDGISYMCVKDGTTTPPEPWPGGAIPLTLHAVTHRGDGTDPVDVKTLAGYPSNPALFLNGTGAFAAPNGGIPIGHHTTHEPGGSDVIQNAAWVNLANTFTQNQLIQRNFPALRLLHSSGPVDQRTWQIATDGDTVQFQPSDDAGNPSVNVPLICQRDGILRVHSGILLDIGYIKFPAIQVPSTDVNVLDDYEEGTWTPTDASGAGLILTNSAGSYIKIGSLVTIGVRVGVPANSSSTPITVGGLPFLVENVPSRWGGYITFTQSGVLHTITCSPNTSTFILLTASGAQVPWSAYTGQLFSAVITYKASA